MRILLDGLTVEKARDILEWLEDPRSRLFYEQLFITEKALFERWLSDKYNEEIPFQIESMRSILQYHDHLLDFLRDRVDAQNK